MTRAITAHHASIVAGGQEAPNETAARVAAETAREAAEVPLEAATEDAAGVP